MSRLAAALAAAAVAATSCAAAGAASRHAAAPATPTSPPPATTAPATVTPTPSATPSPARSPRPVPTAAAVPFASTVHTVTAADLAHSYRPGCPVPPAGLRLVRLTFWGFDGRAHTGEIVVNASVTAAVVDIFRRLYAVHFPVRRMQPVDAYGGSDDRSMAADNTSGFNCRYAVAPGAAHWSAHAYGEAIDIDPVENPYLEGGTVQPPNGAPYAARSPVRPGMAVPGSAVVAAFAADGWLWGGRWTGSPDYQHFSSTGG